LIRTFAFVFVFALTPPAVSGQAQARGFFGGGLTFPAGQVTESHGLGYNVGTQFSWPLTSYLALLGALEYRDVRRDDEATVDRLLREGETRWRDFNEFRLGGGFLDGGNRTSLAGLVNAQILINPGAGALTYYLLAGGGLSRTGLGDLQVYFLGESDELEGHNEVVPVINLGGGVNVQVGQSVGLFAQAGYLTLLTEGGSTSMIPIQVGLSFIMSDRFVR
jgi:hypothetical protein